MKNFDENLLLRVMSDAHVIDVDFSDWDKCVRFYVLADHMEPVAGELPLYVIEFEKPMAANFSFNHHKVNLDSGLRFQWRIDEVDLNESSGLINVTFRCHNTQPRVEIVCDSIGLRQISIGILHRLFPGWNKPNSPLARPSIEKLSAMCFSGKEIPKEES